MSVRSLAAGHRAILVAAAVGLFTVAPASTFAKEQNGTGFGAGVRNDGSVVGSIALADDALVGRLFGGYSNQAYAYEGTTAESRLTGFEVGAMVGYRSKLRKDTFAHFSGIAAYSQARDDASKLTVAFRDLGANLAVGFWPTPRLELLFTPVELVSSSGYVKRGEPSVDLAGWRLRVMRSFWVTYYFE